jgi:hypothetical protein
VVAADAFQLTEAEVAVTSYTARLVGADGAEVGPELAVVAPGGRGSTEPSLRDDPREAARAEDFPEGSTGKHFGVVALVSEVLATQRLPDLESIETTTPPSRMAYTASAVLAGSASVLDAVAAWRALMAAALRPAALGAEVSPTAVAVAASHVVVSWKAIRARASRSTAEMVAEVEASWLRLVTRAKVGIASAARSPRITMTTISSSRVKAFVEDFLGFSSMRPTVLASTGFARVGLL